MRKIDLHIHSTASDGTDTPSEIIHIAVRKKLAAVAITDHDTVSGVADFLKSAVAHPELAAIPGVELSVLYHDNSIHISGLFVDPCDSSLKKLLSEIRRNRDSRNELIIKKLRNLNFDITLEEVKTIAAGESIGRPHLAQILIQKGYFKEPQEVFDKCLKRGAPAYCPRVLPTPAEAVSAIHGAGGLAFWAHPFHRSDSSITYVERILKDLLDTGLDGIEAYYSTFTEEQQAKLLAVAKKLQIPVSGGSDYHGGNMPGIEIADGYGNMFIPETVYENLLKRLGKII